MDIVLENALCRLAVGEDCLVKSLVLKATGEEFAVPAEKTPLFAATQERPFNNEIKLAHPNKRTVYRGARLRREGDTLIAGFETAPYEARIKVKIAPRYLAFTLEGFDVRPSDYGGIMMTPPPVTEFRLIQLPARPEESFGEWLNVAWYQNAVLAVLATSPCARIDSEKRSSCRLMTADARRGVKLRECGAALVLAPEEELLDAVGDLERDFGLPNGAEGRRRAEEFTDNTFFTADVHPGNVDEHLAVMRRCGFRKMQIYYTAIFREKNGYSLDGDYDYRPEYPRGKEDLKEMLRKIREAGVLPGLHFLHTHIGLESRYVRPKADHRLRIARKFTLARALGTGEDEIFVEEDTEGAETHPKRRILRFGGELISYEGYTEDRPRRFTGCRRGAFGTEITPHAAGEIGGILDVSEFGGTSVYLDQDTDLQDEIAGKLANAYDAGFGFIYFDGSEGTNEPYDFHVPNAQYRVLKRLGSEPVYTEGAAKAHFSWHFLTRGNAFDIFPPDLFKSAIDRYPGEEAPRMRLDLTAVDFGWWNIVLPGTPSGNHEFQKKLARDARDGDCGTQADHFEYGLARAAAWDCPVTVQFDFGKLDRHPRKDDLLEALRRWQELRTKGLLTPEEKDALKEPGTEYTLLKGENGELELTRVLRIDGTDKRLRAFSFTG
ncbi:MAG: hypothetical protein IKX85_07715 [Clostridia bacterium]|nr:hypothetical protein [Clostridia bacterium]